MRNIAALFFTVLLAFSGGKAYGVLARTPRAAPLSVTTREPSATPVPEVLGTATAPFVNAPTAAVITSTPPAPPPTDCPPPPWLDMETAARCYLYYPAPFATPLPYCPLDYTLPVRLTCWGYVVVDPGIYPSPPPGGWPTPPEQPTPNSGYPAPYP